MSYTSNTLGQLGGAIGGRSRWWTYETADAVSVVLGSGYITDADKKHMQVGDMVLVRFGTLNTTGPDQVPSTHARGTVSEFASAPGYAVLEVSSITTGAATLVAPGPQVINVSTSTSAAGAVTLNAKAGIITTESLTTASQATYTLTITNSQVTVGDLVLGTIQNGSNTTGIPVLESVVPGAGILTVKIGNASTTTTPFGGSLKFSFVDLSATP